MGLQFRTIDSNVINEKPTTIALCKLQRDQDSTPPQSRKHLLQARSPLSAAPQYQRFLHPFAHKMIAAWMSFLAHETIYTRPINLIQRPLLFFRSVTENFLYPL